MEIKIRKAIISDIPRIHELVIQLAVYERAPEEVITTPEIYIQDFADNRFDAFVAEAENEIVGMALFYWAYSTWKGKYIWLEDFIVREDMRMHGIGKLLFDAVLNECKQENIKVFKWQVLDWNTPAIKFYEKYNSEWQKEWLTYRIEF